MDDDDLRQELMLFTRWQELTCLNDEIEPCFTSSDTHTQVLTHQWPLHAKEWRRLGLLLFSCNQDIVRAVVANMEAIVKIGCVVSTKDRIQPQHEIDIKQVVDRPLPLHPLLERRWIVEWSHSIMEKIRDYHEQAIQSARLVKICLKSSVVENMEESNSDDVQELPIRLLNVLVDILMTYTVDCNDHTFSPHPLTKFDCPGEGLGVETQTRIVDLLWELATSAKVNRITIAATTALLRLLIWPVNELNHDIVEYVLTNTGVDMMAMWLLQAPEEEKDITIEQRLLQSLYLQVLVHAVTRHSIPANRIVSQQTNTGLQLCTKYFNHPNTELQHHALILLTVLLQPPSTAIHITHICAFIRLSGTLITILWLMGHSSPQVALAAVKVMELIIANSPKTDLVRAMIEQGCLVICHILLQNTLPSPPNSDNFSLCEPKKKVLQWIKNEAQQEVIIQASISSIMRSTNILLQKNVILSLLLLSRSSPAAKDLLQAERFHQDIVRVAIESSDDEDAKLAALLLSAALSSCDKSSALKLEDTGRDSKKILTNKSGNGSSTNSPSHPTSILPPIELRCASDRELLTADGKLLAMHSNLLQRFKDQTHQELPENGSFITLPDHFQVSTVRLWLDLLPKSQQEAAIALTYHPLAQMLNLLEFAKYVDSPKCWHFTTFAICRALTQENWLQIFRFGAKIRHPMLILRTLRFALDLHDQQQSNRSQLTCSADLNVRLYTEIKIAACEFISDLFAT